MPQILHISCVPDVTHNSIIFPNSGISFNSAAIPFLFVDMCCNLTFKTGLLYIVLIQKCFWGVVEFHTCSDVTENNRYQHVLRWFCFCTHSRTRKTQSELKLWGLERTSSWLSSRQNPQRVKRENGLYYVSLVYCKSMVWQTVTELHCNE